MSPSARDGGKDARADAGSKRRDGGGIDDWDDAPDAAFAACATDTFHATLVPLDLYLRLDSSGSMNELTAGSVSKWSAVGSALSAFFHDAKSTGTSVALQFFPIANPGYPHNARRVRNAALMARAHAACACSKDR